MTNNEKIEQIDEQRLVDDDRMHACMAGRKGPFITDYDSHNLE